MHESWLYLTTGSSVRPPLLSAVNADAGENGGFATLGSGYNV